MSWLNTVGKFLEQLDDSAEKAVEEQRAKQEDETEPGEAENKHLESILAARGLAVDGAGVAPEGDLKKQPAIELENLQQDEKVSDSRDSEVNNSDVPAPEQLLDPNDAGTQAAESSQAMENCLATTKKENDNLNVSLGSPERKMASQDNALDPPTRTQDGKVADSDAAPKLNLPLPKPPNPRPEATPTSSAPRATDGGTSPAAELPRRGGEAAPKKVGSSESPAGNSTTNALASNLREAQKETRTLRRHVVTLNSQLTKAEDEIQAQRKELEGAGAQMEKDRAKHKQEREKEMQKHSDELKRLKVEYESALDALRGQLHDMERQRVREGGDLSKELQGAIDREKESIQKLAMLQDEKETLLAQISTMQSQQEALGSRLESLSSAADNAMEREGEAEKRLDEILSAHARQMSQRQARETELERTVAELGAELVAVRSRATNLPSRQQLSEAADALPTPSSDAEIEAMRAQLVHEQMRNAALHEELLDLSRERTEEASVLQARQHHNDKQIADQAQAIARLKAELQDAKRISAQESAQNAIAGEGVDAVQIKSLSEELLKQREKAIGYTSEISALKSRLRAANDRAALAEVALEEREHVATASDWSDVERPNGGTVSSGPMRRRGVNSRRKKDTPSIRSALHLEGARDERTERIGKSLDALDSFLAQSGRFLRFNPVARLLFIVYLLLLHAWTFVLLFLHAHGYETVHGDFGSGGDMPHGPGALMQQHAPLQNAAQAVASGNAASVAEGQ